MKKKSRRPRAFNSTLPAPTKRLSRKKRLQARQVTQRKPRKRLPHTNPKRQAKRRARGMVRGPHSKWVRTRFQCLLKSDPRHSCTGRIDPHHVDTVGAGKDDRYCVPLCRGAHTMSPLSVHVMGVDSFQAYWQVDLYVYAAFYWHISPHNPENAFSRRESRGRLLDLAPISDAGDLLVQVDYPGFNFVGHTIDSIARALGVDRNALTSTEGVIPHEVDQTENVRIPARTDPVGGSDGNGAPPAGSRL